MELGSEMIATLRDAVRQVVRSRRNVLPAALCAALGLAAAGAVGALLGVVFVRPLPFPHAERLVRVWMAHPDAEPRIDLTVPELEAVVDHVSSFEAVAGSARVREIGLFPDGALRLRGEAVTADYFAVTGVRPAIGRLFEAGDFEQPVTLLAHGTWLARYGGDPQVVGRTLRTTRGEFTILGVLPSWFHGAIEHDEVEFWIPLPQLLPRAALADATSRRAWVLARLRDGVGLAAAQDEVASLRAELGRRHAEIPAALELRVEPAGENWRGNLRGPSTLLASAALALLAIAIGNCAALLAVRARERAVDLAVRGALGATPRRLAVGLLVESTLVAAAGGFAGLALAQPLLRAFLSFAPLPLPGYLDLAPDRRALLIGFAATLVAGACAGFAPARLATRVSPLAALRKGGRAVVGRRRGGVRALLAGQLAMALALTLLGSALVASYAGLAKADLGFPRERLLRMAMTFSNADLGDDGDAIAELARLRERLASHPDVARVGFVAPTLPPWNGWQPRLTDLPGAPPEGVRVSGHEVDRGLFELFGLEAIAGRLPSSAEIAAAAPLAVVSATLAERWGGAAEAVGRRLSLAETWSGEREATFTVVGVVPDVAWDAFVDGDNGRRLRTTPGDGFVGLDLYVPLDARQVRVVSIGIAPRGEPTALADALRREIATVAPTSAVHWVSEMEDELARENVAPRFQTLLVGAFAATALTLAGSGLLAFLAALALARRREFAVRRAVGADSGSIALLVLADAARLVVPATAVGLTLAWAIRELLARRVDELAPLAPANVSAALALFLVLGFVSALVPTHRALADDPAAALRAE